MFLQRILRKVPILWTVTFASAVIGLFVYAMVDRTVVVSEQLNVIPGKVVSDSWSAVENVLISDISDYSLYQDFSPRNSAYLDLRSLIELKPELNPNPVVPQGTSTYELLTPDTESKETEVIPDPDNGSTVPNETTSDLETPASPDEEVSPEVVEETAPEPEPEVVSTPTPTPAPVVDTPAEQSTETEVVSWGIFPKANKLYPLAQEIISGVVTSTNESSPATSSEEEANLVEPDEAEEELGEIKVSPAEEELEEVLVDEEVLEETTEEEEELASSTEEEGPIIVEEEIEVEPVLEVEPVDVMDACAGDPDCKMYSTVFSDFAMPEFESGTFLTAAQLRLSLAAQTVTSGPNELHRYVVEYTYSSDEKWNVATIIDIEDEISNSINGGFFLVSLERPINQSQLSNLQVRISYQGNIKNLRRAYIEGLWLEVTSSSFFEEVSDLLSDEELNFKRNLLAPKFHSLDSVDRDVVMGDLPIFTLDYSPQEGFLRRIAQSIFGENTYAVNSVKITDVQGNVVSIPVDVVYQDDTKWTVKFLKQPHKMIPGKYKVELSISENDNLYLDSFEFYWGVLAVNTTKTMYWPDEEITLNLAALTDRGDTICNADLELKIITPSNSIFEIPVEQSGSCGKNNVTDVPDYLAYFKETTEVGRYKIQLNHKNRLGEVVHKVQDFFEVREYIPYDIERTAPTRIYPPAPYDVILKITANRTFTGDIKERVPRGFILSDSGEAEISTGPDFTELIWRGVELIEGQELILGYSFDAPDISPYMYLLGPLDMDGFKELRQWQIASDALGAVAYLTGTRLSGGVEINTSAPEAIDWSTSTVDSFYFSHSTSTDKHRLNFNQSGDYLVSLTVPVNRLSTDTNRARWGTEIRLNGVAVDTGLSRTGYIRGNAGNGHMESSNHSNILLTGITAGDYISVYSELMTTYDSGISAEIAGQASLYVEYIGPGQNVFAGKSTFAIASTSATTTDLNQAFPNTLSWIETRQDTGFVHSDTVNPQNIIISDPGAYMVQINVPLTSGDTAQRPNVLGRVLLDGAEVPGGQFKQGYIRGTTVTSDGDASIHWSGVVIATTTNQVLTITGEREAVAGVVNITSGFAGSVFIQKLPTTDVIVLRGNQLVANSDDWNPATPAAVQWVRRDAFDAALYTHSTSSNSQNIIVNTAGDYYLVFNEAVDIGTASRQAPKVTIRVNGTPILGAQTQTNYMRDGNHNNASAALSVLLSGLAASSTITVVVEQEANSGTVNDTTDAIVMLWKKAEINLRPEVTIYDTPFDNIRFASTTPYFRFTANDLDGSSDIQYQFQISTSSSFTASTTRTSGVDAGFENVDTPAESSPYTENQQISFQLQPADALTDLNTYYWRVRAKDTDGSNQYGDWSDTRSLVINLGATTPNWYQAQSSQFLSNTLLGVTPTAGLGVRVDATVSSEVLFVYGESTNPIPKYRLWNGVSWGSENSALTVDGTINWLKSASAVSREEYILVTIDSTNRAYAQVYTASTSSWTNKILMSNGVASPSQWGIAVAYESVSGDAMVAACETGANPVYRIWNGSSWSATSSVIVNSAQPCGFLEFASDPASDELILVTRDTTASQYEAHVWNGSAWSETNILGSGQAGQENHSGVGLAYETSGEQAIVAVTNGTANNFIYSAWNGTEWSTNATVNLGNDLEFAEIATDPNSDKMALCYIDADSDVGVVEWDGGVWSTYFELDTSGNDVDGRPIDCVYETEPGRSGILMAVYSDTVGVRYRTYSSSTWSGEINISGVNDSFWVQSERAGNGKVVAASLDDVIDDIEAYEWNGSTWSTKTTIEGTPSSLLANPYKVFDLSAKRFVYTAGTVKTPPIDFSFVPDQPTWGDITFSTIEPFGTDVTVRVMYTNVTECDSYIPNGDLSGNGSGFGVEAVPIDLTGLSTSTYTQLCLEATLTTQGGASSELSSWSLSWIRAPKLIQNAYRWYVNGSFLTPTDPWPVGVSDVAENTPLDSTNSVNINSTIRLRMSLRGSNVPLPAFSEAFKLQYAEGLTCSPALGWSDVGGIASTTALWRGYENSIVGSDWYNGSWGRRIQLTVQNSVVDDDVTDFPVYVNLADLPPGFFNNVQSDGDDIRITTSDGLTEVPFELVSIDTGSDTGELHFKATLSSTTNTSYYLYYDNSAASGYAPSATYGSQNVWTNGYQMRHALDDSPVAASPQFKDSTSNNNNAVAYAGMTAGDVVPGRIGSGIDLDGNDGATFQSALAYTGVFTASMWWNTNGDGFAIAGPSGANEKMGPWSSPANRMFVRTVSSSDTTIANPTDGTWAYVALTRDSSNKVDLHLNGVTSRLYGDAAQAGTSDWVNFGGETSQGFRGILDELRFANVRRTNGWLTTEYNNQSNPTGFYSVSAEELISDGKLLPGTLLTDSDNPETYVEKNPTRENQAGLPVGDDAEWDFVIQNNLASANTNYCFRMVYTDGSVLNNYTNYPRLVTNAPPPAPTLSAPFDNERLASTTPWFDFSTDDELGDDVAYQIQISTTFDFASPAIDNNSISHFAQFTNLSQPSQKSTFTSGETIRFEPGSPLSNGVTYWWRVRASDPDGSGTYGNWSNPESFTVNTATIITTWFQTTGHQFLTNSLLDATSSLASNDIGIESGFTVATTTSTIIDYDDRDKGNAWGQLSFVHNVTSGTIRYRVEYRVSGETFALIPDVALPGNSTGFTSSPVSLVGLNTTTYNEIRIVAVLTGNSTLPRLQDWTVTWSETIEIPTHLTPFDNAKVSTTTPSFTFFTTDPENHDIQYEVETSSTYDFASHATYLSGVDAGFTNVTTATDTSPFFSGNTIRYQTQSALVNGNTYWWRVRARDPLGSNTWSEFSEPTSFTIDTSITRSVWFQTTGDQFSTDDLFDIETTAGGAQITSIVRGVMVAYGEGAGQSPRYRLWDGVSWGSALTAQSINAQIYWLELEASPTRPEYALASIGTDNDVNVQIYNANTGLWGNVLETEQNIFDYVQKGVDIAYETTSGDLMVVNCSGTEATYAIWNGTSWSATTSISLTNSNNCLYVDLSSDPTSDEIIAVFKHTNTGDPDYEALVWNGSSWGNSQVFGSIAENGNAGMAVNYEESGNQAIVTLSNGATTNFIWSAWNGTSWSGTQTVNLGDHFEWASLRRDVGTDNMALCYIDNDNDIGVVRWNGSAWSAFQEIEVAGNTKLGQAVDCAYETEGARDSYIMVPYSDTISSRYQFWDGASFSGESNIASIQDVWRVTALRAADGRIHAAFLDDVNDRYDVSNWDGAGWTSGQTLSNSPSITGTPFDGSLSMSAQIFPNFTSGSIRSTPIRFSDGSGPRWDFASWSNTKPGASNILYRVYYQSAPGIFSLIPDTDLPGNSAGFSTSPINLGAVDRTIYSVLKLDAQFICNSGDCPSLEDWSVSWSEGIAVSGTAREFDAVSTTTSGTVAVAVNGVLQVGKTGSISATGTWSIANVTAFPGDTVTVFVDGAADADESVAIATYNGVGDMTGMELNKRHLTIGSNSAATTTNAGFAAYDNTDDEDLFFTVGVGNILTFCVESACNDGKLKIKSGTNYAPGANVTARDFQNFGTFTPATSTIRVGGSWNNQGTFREDTSTIIFTATTSSSTLTNATSTFTFYNVTFGETTGSSTWNLTKPLIVRNNLSVNFGTLARGTSTLNISGNLAIGVSGNTTGLATTTFAGTGGSTWGDAKPAASSTNVGYVVVDGTAKTITLSGNVGAETVTIGADDTLNASGSGFNINVYRSWINNNAFVPQTGTVTFIGTSTGAITRGASAFNNLTFSGVGGMWSFVNPTLALNGNFTIATGTATLPTGTTTIAGSFNNSGGTFLHNNGEVRMTSSAAGRTITQSGTAFLNAFYDLVFSGSGAWSFNEVNATTSRDFRIQSGTVTFPTGALTIGGDMVTTGSGSFVHNNGEVILMVQDTDDVRANGSSFNNLKIVAGVSSGWYNESWQYRIPVSISASQIDANLTNFPVYVNLSNFSSHFFNNVKSSGADIRVTAGDGLTELPREVVSVSTSTANGELYFRADSVSSTTDTTFYVYYGNAAASDYAGGDPYGFQNVWSNGYVIVAHMGDLTTSTILNSANTTRNGTKSSANNPLGVTTGKIYNAQDNSGDDTVITNVGLGASNITISSWFNADDLTGSGDTATYGFTIFSAHSAGAYTWVTAGGTGGGGAPNEVRFCAFSSSATCNVTSGANINTGNWHYVSASAVDGGAANVRVNGSPVLSFTSDGGGDWNSDSTIGDLRAARNIEFDGRLDEVRISNVVRSAAWQDAEYRNTSTTTSFYTVSGYQSSRTRIFTDTNATVLGNVTIESGGKATFPSGILSVGGSFTNTGEFLSNNGTVRFNSSAGAETINAGSSTFATLDFNHAGGDFTVTSNATATVAINLTNLQQFTQNSGTTLTTLGTFNHLANGASTTWTGSTLRLANATTTNLNVKSHAGDVYGTIEAASSTLVKMWNSSATSYLNTGSSSAIYSQDHAGVDGNLNIYGNYTRSTGTEFWSGVTDFDGVSLAGFERQANVRLASSTQVLIQNSSLNMVGSSTASTTIDSISGTYALTASSTAITAQYFTVANTNLSGLVLTGSTTVPTFSDGLFTVNPSSSGITVSATAVDNNIAKQIFRVGFATSSPGSATNVTQNGGAPTSYWWFRDSFGNLSGEAFDADTGNPGSIRWDDSTYGITVSGTVYSDEGVTPMGVTVCDDVTPVVRVMINGVTSFSGPCSSLDGSYSIPNVAYAGDPNVLVYLNSNGAASQPSAITLRSETSAAGTTNGATGNFTVNRPGGIANGDLLVVIIGKDDSPAITAPAGWVTGDTLGSASGNLIRTGIWYKRITSSSTEPASYTFTGDVGEGFSYWIGSLVNADPVTPEDVTFSGRWLNSQNDTTPNALSVTTVTDGVYVLAASYIDNDNAITAPNAPWSTRAVNVFSSDNNNLVVSSRSMPTPGATGDTTVTNVAGSMESNNGQFAFRRMTYASSTVKGAVVTRTPTAAITNLHIYQNRLITRHENVTPISIANLTSFTSSNDSDVPFAATLDAPNTLTVVPNTELHVWATTTFTPGGNVNLQSSGSGNAFDGSLHIANGATFTGAGTETHSVGGSFSQDNSATFIPASTTVIMTATTTGKTISPASGATISFNQLNFTGVGGGWNINGNISATADISIATGTVTGTGNITVTNGSLYGDGTLSLGTGTTTISRTNNLGGIRAWTFNNLILGNSTTSGTTTRVANATTTISGVLTISNAHFLNAGGSVWDLSGTGNVFVRNGTFVEATSTVRYSGAGANVLSTNYYNLLLSAGVGSPTYTAVGSGILVNNNLTIGGGTNSVFNVNTNDPVLQINGNVLINSNGTFEASNSATTSVAGNWTNTGVFNGNSGTINFNGTGSSNIAAGNSSFSNVNINGTGNFTITQNATSTGAFLLTNHNNFTVNSGVRLAVGGQFTNGLAGALTTFTGSTLALYGVGTYTINSATTSDNYNILTIATSTQIRMWNSRATTTTVSNNGSLYSQDHNNVDGDLYVWGLLNRTSGNDHWSYATDFDGTDLSGGSERLVRVYMASGTNAFWSGTSSLTALGTSTASTTVQNQGAGTYNITFGTGATTNWNRVQVRNTGINGITFAGTPTVTDFSRIDYLVAIPSGSAITVGGTALNANPAKNFTYNVFNSSAGGTKNVTATGTAITSWRYTNYIGNIGGEAFDDDPAGDPGYIVWDDSAALITVSGNVYSDEGSTVSSVCDGVTPNIRLVIANAINDYSTTCAAGTGAYSIPNVSFGPLDTLTLYINGETQKAANVSVAAISSIYDMHLYENRVIVRHENTDPLTIANMAVWDSSDDADLPYTAIDAGTDTLTLPANTKLLIWAGKTFKPGGNVTLSGGGAGAAHDGTLEGQTNSRFQAEGTQSHSIGGSLIMGTGAIWTGASSTLTMTTTGAARTFDVNSAILHDVNFTGSGSWTAVDSTLTLTGSYTQSAGAVTLPTGTTTIGRAFNVTSGTFVNSGSPFVFTATTTGNIVRFNNSPVASLRFTGTGSWSMTDVNATSTGSVNIVSGTVTLPSGNFAIGGNFIKSGGTFLHNTSDLILTATTSATLTASSSDLYAIHFAGPATYTISDSSITFLESFTVSSGTVNMATGTTAVGGSFIATGGTFVHSTGTVLLNATSSGKTVNPGTSSFTNLQIGAPAGGYTFTGNSTTTNNFTIASVNNLTVNSGVRINVGGVFTNSVGGAATTWTGSILRLYGQSPYSINTRLNSGDVYGTLILSDNVDVRAWYSSAATTTVSTSSSYYSQDHANVNGDLYIYGDLVIATTTEYWNYAKDFDGTVLTGGSERRARVYMAQNATTTVTTGSVQILGISGSSTLIRNQSTGTYAFAVTGGSINANEYSFANLDIRGLDLSGLSTVTDLANGYYDLAVNTGSLITLSSTTLNVNPSKIFNNVGFNATATLSGFNVNLVGTTSNAWSFPNGYGNIGGEGFDIDGLDACGSIRFSNSSCLLVEQTHFRWRNDDGGEGAANSEWFDTSWSYRQRVRVLNNDNQAYASTAIKVAVTYDGGMKSDFSDLRFTSSGGTTTIPFWVERYTASTDATVWVKVPSLVASDYTTVFMYFGSSTASSTSSGTSTFTVFDDYEDANITEYSGDTSLFTTGVSPVYGGARSLVPVSTSGKTTNGIFRFDTPVSQGQRIRYMQYVNTAGTSDEPCTLFGVQSPGTTNQNYAICLEQFGVDRMSISKNVKNNDSSGTVLASTTVTYSTGWYEVEVDWRTNNTIGAALYNSAGTLVASTSASDSSYTSGGYGYAFWFQNGAWDSFTARPRVITKPTVYIGARQTSGGATWSAPLDTVTGSIPGDTMRLRLSVENSGLQITNQLFLLEYAAKGVSPTCGSVSGGSFVAVPNQASCGSSPVCMQTSVNVSNGDNTTDLLAGTDGTFITGKVVASPSNQSTALDINQNYYTELEYVITPTINAVDNYCFRVTNAGTPLDFYGKVAELGLQFDPSIPAVDLNNGLDISLTTGTTTAVYVTGTTTDLNGYTDLVHATATVYRSGVGASCTPDNNNCFVLTTGNGKCSFTNCAGSSCLLSCRADIPFHADPTDADAYEGQEWLAYAEVEDSSAGYDFASASGVELITLRAMGVNSLINYGSLPVQSDTGSTNATTTVTNLGNAAFNIDVTGTDLTDGGTSAIPADQQKVSTSTFTYSACVTCQQLSTSTPVTVGINLNKPSVSTPPVTTEVYWGIAVPFGINSAPHSGVNVFTPISI